MAGAGTAKSMALQDIYIENEPDIVENISYKLTSKK